MGLLPLIYNGDIKNFNNFCQKLKNGYPNYNNFIENYFIPKKLNYFLNGEYNFDKIREDCKSNSFLENYNKYLKWS